MKRGLRFHLLLIPLLIAQGASALCTDEATDLDSCLQCCTDTAQTALAIEGNPKLASDMASLCKNNQKVDSEKFKAFYAKYKLEGTIYLTACANPQFLQDQKFNAEPYVDCVKTCEAKFKEKTK